MSERRAERRLAAILAVDVADYSRLMGKDEEGTQDSRTIFFANFPGVRPSLEREKHGLFAQVILDGLKGAADTQGYEPDGLVIIDELVEYAEKKGTELARKHDKNRAAGEVSGAWRPWSR